MSPTSAEEGGGQHRPDAEQPEQAGVGLGDRGLDLCLHGGDSLLQLAYVSHELGGQLPAGDCRRAGRGHFTEQGGGALGGEVAPGTTRD
jgi:hypothetical protein